MMDELLRLLGSGRALRIEEVSNRLRVPEGFVLSMIEDLLRRGYLSDLTAGTAGCSGCAGCPKGNSSSVRQTPRMWGLTEKGAAVLNQPAS